MNDKNPLLNLIASTAVWPGHVMTDYLDESSESSFFIASRDYYQFHQEEYPITINEFFNNLEDELTTLNRQLFLKHSIFQRIKRESIAVFISSLALYGIGTLIAYSIITHEKNEIKSKMSDTTYSLNSSSHCDALLDQRVQIRSATFLFLSNSLNTSLGVL